MQVNDDQVRASDGLSPTVEPVPVSPLRASIPDAGMLPNITYLSCGLCHGTRETKWGPCSSCADPEPALARWMLERLKEQQIDFLRAYSHTLAYQPITKAEYERFTCEYFVEADDGVWDEDAEMWLIPNTSHWFASGMHRYGPHGAASFIRYNPMGLLLRECLMCGAGAMLPHMYPSRRAQGTSAGTAETGTGSGLQPAGPVGETDAPEATGDHPC